MSLHSGERQVAPTIEGIRRDHVARYTWAAALLDDDAGIETVCDFGCGVGYGSFILAERGLSVDGIDIDEEAIDYAEKHYSHHNNLFHGGTGRNLMGEPFCFACDAYVCFEVIEHIREPAPFLQQMDTDRLLASVPNETVYPHASLVNPQHHVRHYTKAQFEELLNSCGWKVQAWYTQDGPDSEVRPGDNGMTLIVDAVR